MLAIKSYIESFYKKNSATKSRPEGEVENQSQKKKYETEFDSILLKAIFFLYMEAKYSPCDVDTLLPVVEKRRRIDLAADCPESCDEARGENMFLKVNLRMLQKFHASYHIHAKKKSCMQISM